MTLYLTYRPQSFADVVGQDHIVTTLERAIERDRISHAYLFCGTRGTGKTSVARILAKTILLSGITDDNLRTTFTKAIEDGSFVDLIEIDAASNRKIDDVRDLIERINFSPSIVQAKVYIIDEVHMLTKEAFNALLKTLEEPPPYAYFILATTELHKVPDTIQSRCQRFLFHRVKDDDIIRRLQYIADRERITVEREALRAIARHAQGSFRDGIALLDQLRSLEKISLADVTDRIGKTSVGFLDDLLQSLTDRNAERIVETVRQMEEANIPVDTVAGDLLGVAREGLHAMIEKGQSTTESLRMIDILLKSLRDMRSSPLPGLVLEAALLSLCNSEESSPSQVKTRKATDKESRTVTSPPAPPSEPVKIKNDLPPPSAAIEAEELTAASVARHWETILKMVSSSSVRMSLKDATISGVEGNVITLTFGSSFHQGKVADTKASRAVEEALLTVFKRPVRIHCVTQQESSSPRAMGPDTDLAAAAAEVFGGF
ncbi:MAG: DNA polymerase III subunit gamma/tau [Candidatus Peribacteraceae bacterium]|nr:DNA polymerase III subunit gamma/tau [Candidatus Peribacteraceae bacterium]